jgi:hypothetical protein
MVYGILADILVWFHLTFVLFSVLGALLVIWRRWFLWLHFPAVIWAVWIEMTGGICPLTPFENWLRNRAGQGGYRGDFVEHYLMPVLYPVGLTRNLQITLGVVVIIINTSLYGSILWRFRRTK